MTYNNSVIDTVLSHSGLKKSIKWGSELHHSQGGLGLFMPKEEDARLEDIDFLIAQDQNGFNAGSFFIRRSSFSQLMVDMWRDPLFLKTPNMLEQDTLVRTSILLNVPIYGRGRIVVCLLTGSFCITDAFRQKPPKYLVARWARTTERHQCLQCWRGRDGVGEGRAGDAFCRLLGGRRWAMSEAVDGVLG